MALTPARIIIVMGVSSSGKSTIGKSIARRLHVPFLDGDGYHPAANVEKMRAGTPRIDPRDKGRLSAAILAGHYELGLLTRRA